MFYLLAQVDATVDDLTRKRYWRQAIYWANRSNDNELLVQIREHEVEDSLYFFDSTHTLHSPSHRALSPKERRKHMDKSLLHGKNFPKITEVDMRPISFSPPSKDKKKIDSKDKTMSRSSSSPTSSKERNGPRNAKKRMTLHHAAFTGSSSGQQQHHGSIVNASGASFNTTANGGGEEGKERAGSKTKEPHRSFERRKNLMRLEEDERHLQDCFRRIRAEKTNLKWFLHTYHDYLYVDSKYHSGYAVKMRKLKDTLEQEQQAALSATANSESRLHLFNSHGTEFDPHSPQMQRENSDTRSKSEVDGSQDAVFSARVRNKVQAVRATQQAARLTTRKSTRSGTGMLAALSSTSTSSANRPASHVDPTESQASGAASQSLSKENNYTNNSLASPVIRIVPPDSNDNMITSSSPNTPIVPVGVPSISFGSSAAHLSNSPGKKKHAANAVFKEFHEAAALSRRKSSVEGLMGVGSAAMGAVAGAMKRRQSLPIAEESEIPIMKRRNSIEQVMQEMDEKEKQKEQDLQTKAQLAKRRKSMAAQEASPKAKDVQSTILSLKEQLQKSKQVANAAYDGNF
ncbi:unnamed protein product [Amoebophrya sp. A120]|nr:unnamed protein product [Amoebophrya sp. A120]|eukprot:GSA120T00003765001.1